MRNIITIADAGVFVSYLQSVRHDKEAYCDTSFFVSHREDQEICDTNIYEPSERTINQTPCHGQRFTANFWMLLLHDRAGYVCVVHHRKQHYKQYGKLFSLERFYTSLENLPRT